MNVLQNGLRDLNTNSRRRFQLLAAVLFFFAVPAFAQETAARVATAEGLLARPTAMAIDELGRLFVAEAPASGQPGDGNGGRVIRVEDKDGDGTFETATEFAAGLHWPMGLACWNGGVLVADTPDILFLKDSNGDGVAESRESVLTGFGGGAPGEVLSGLAWGSDLRIHGRAGSAPAAVRRSAAPNDPPLALTGKGFVFDPRTLAISAEMDVKNDSDSSTTSDAAFHVLQRYVGPRGTEYVVESHCCGVEPNDFTGRIVRAKGPSDAPAAPGEAVAMLATGGRWECETAARLIYAAQDRSVAPRLAELLRTAPQLPVRIAALRTLAGIDALSPATLDAAFGDVSPEVRINALDIAAPLILQGVSGALQQRATALAVDTDLTVRRQAAISLQALPLWMRGGAYARLCAAGTDDDATRAAVVAGIGENAPALLCVLLGNADLVADAKNEAMLTDLAYAAGANAGALNVLEAVAGVPEALRGSLVAGLAQGACSGRNWPLLHKLSDDKGPLGAAMAAAFVQARDTAADTAADAVKRAAAMALVAHDPNSEGVTSLFTGSLTFSQPIAVQVAAISALATAPSKADVVGPVLAALPGLGPQTRKAAVDLLLSRADWCLATLEALEAGTITLKAFDASQVDQLLKHPSVVVRDRAAALFANFGVGPNAQKVTELGNLLQLKPDAAHGKQLFTENCSKCHAFAGEGFKLAPELSFMAKSGGYALLKSILDPNADVLPQYFSYTVETNDFETFTGIIAEETNTDILVRGPSGEDHRVPRENISTFTCSEKTMMPEEWETSLGPQNIADLIGYLTETVAKPKLVKAQSELAP